MIDYTAVLLHSLYQQESEIEAAAWVPIAEYSQQDAFKDVPLHVKLSER